MAVLKFVLKNDYLIFSFFSLIFLILQQILGFCGKIAGFCEILQINKLKMRNQREIFKNYCSIQIPQECRLGLRFSCCRMRRDGDSRLVGWNRRVLQKNGTANTSDLTKCYGQSAMDPKDVSTAAFTASRGHQVFLKRPFGPFQQHVSGVSMHVSETCHL